MFSPSGIVLSLSGCMMILFQPGDSLHCHTCIHPNDPNCYLYTSESCDSAQDTCFKFEGTIATADALFRGITIRSCASISVVRALSRHIGRERCQDVSAVFDPTTRQRYNGRFCLCENSGCNSGHRVRFLLWIISVLTLLCTLLTFAVPALL